MLRRLENRAQKTGRIPEGQGHGYHRCRESRVRQMLLGEGGRLREEMGDREREMGGRGRMERAEEEPNEEPIQKTESSAQASRNSIFNPIASPLPAPRSIILEA